MRINFVLEKEIFNKFSKQAQSRGISKTSLLKEWINNTSSLNLLTYTSIDKESITFNMKIDSHTSELIKENANKFKLNKSHYLRLVIINNLTYKSKLNESSYLVPDYKKLWKEGNLKQITEVLGCDIEKMTFEQLIYYARANIEIGYIYKAKDAINYINESINKKELSLNQKAIKRSIEGDIEVYFNNLTKAKILLNEGLEYALKSQERGTIGRILSQLGEIAYILDDFTSLKNYYESALEYLDILNFPIEIAEIYMMFAAYYSAQSDKERNNYYLNRAECLINQSQNIYYKGWFLNESSMSNSTNKNARKAHKDIIQSFSLHTKSGSLMKTYYSYSINAKIEALRNNYSSALSLIKKAKKISKELNIDSPFTSVNFLELYILSRFNFNDSIKEFEKRLSKMSDNSEGKLYLLNSAKYLHTNNIEIKENARINLLKLKSTAKSKVLRNYIESTFKEKIIQPIR